MNFKLFLGIGTVVLILITLYTGKKYGLAVWKRVVLAIAGVAVGVAGTVLMFFVENGRFDGRSFFGAVFFAPLLLIPIGLLLRIKPLDTLDLYAPCESAILVMMKINCYITRCCVGRVIHVTEYGKQIRFPSQICEAVAGLLILVFLLVLIIKNKDKGNVYFWYMFVYGVIRFILNLFRETTPFILNLPAGNFWALISLIIGGGALIIRHRLHRNKNHSIRGGENNA